MNVSSLFNSSNLQLVWVILRYIVYISYLIINSELYSYNSFELNKIRLNFTCCNIAKIVVLRNIFCFKKTSPQKSKLFSHMLYAFVLNSQGSIMCKILPHKKDLMTKFCIYAKWVIGNLFGNVIVSNSRHFFRVIHFI